MLERWREQQVALCRKYGAVPVDVDEEEKLGIAENVRTALLPINGMRTRPENGTCGWYIWAGPEMSTAEDFFKPLHVRHVGDWCKDVLPFLQLPPGWRFLVAPNHVDVWFDPNLDLSSIEDLK